MNFGVSNVLFSNFLHIQKNLRSLGVNYDVSRIMRCLCYFLFKICVCAMLLHISISDAKDTKLLSPHTESVSYQDQSVSLFSNATLMWA